MANTIYFVNVDGAGKYGEASTLASAVVTACWKTACLRATANPWSYRYGVAGNGFTAYSPTLDKLPLFWINSELLALGVNAGRISEDDYNRLYAENMKRNRLY